MSPPVPACVVAVTALEADDRFPAASNALTVYEYCVDPASPVSVNDVVVLLPASVVPRYTLYPVTPTSSVEAVHVSDTVLLVVPVTFRPVGADGGVVSPLVPPPAISSPYTA